MTHSGLGVRLLGPFVHEHLHSAASMGKPDRPELIIMKSMWQGGPGGKRKPGLHQIPPAVCLGMCGCHGTAYACGQVPECRGI